MNISRKIEELEKKLSSAVGIIEEQSKIIKSQSILISKQTEEIKSLKAALKLKEVKKTSKNSHLPPSKDLGRVEPKKNQSLRKKSNKPVGGQLGHKGTTLLMSETPDEIIDLRPNYCNKCGATLLDQPSKMVSRRQLIDIPPIIPTVTEYRNYEVMCNCGHCQKEDYPQGVTNHVQYGPNIQSIVIYQNVYQYVPFQRLQDFFAKIMGLKISKGTLENIIRRTSKKAESTYEQLRKVIEVSFFVGSDETGAKLKGKKMWFWVWQSAIVTYIVAACTRSKQVIEDTFPEGLPNSILCSDRLAAQLSTVSKGTQICLVHLLRDLNYLIEKEQTEWAKSFKQLLKDAIQLKQEQAQYNKTDEKVIEIENRANKLLKKSFDELNWTKEKQHKTMTFYKGMVKLRHALFPFLYHKTVPPDNNSSERAVRPIKVKMKISGQFKSLQQEFAILRSVIDTAIKNGQPVFEAIQAIINLPNKATG